MISFTKTRNNSGPKMDPCGTPKLMGSAGEVILLRLTDWERCDK